MLDVANGRDRERKRDPMLGSARRPPLVVIGGVQNFRNCLKKGKERAGALGYTVSAALLRKTTAHLQPARHTRWNRSVEVRIVERLQE